MLSKRKDITISQIRMISLLNGPKVVFSLGKSNVKIFCNMTTGIHFKGGGRERERKKRRAVLCLALSMTLDVGIKQSIPGMISTRGLL